MELDDLKQTWQKTQPAENKNTDIMKLTQHESYGPIAALKRSLRKDIAFMMLLPFILILTNLDNIWAPLTSVMFWSYVVFCIGVIVFKYRNYVAVSKMSNMDRMVKANLGQQIDALEKQFSRSVMAMRFVLLYFIVLAEVMPAFQNYRSLRLWHETPAIWRFAAYAGLFLMQHFMGRRVLYNKVGRHIGYLRTLIQEME
jgi:hypothetical protein